MCGIKEKDTAPTHAIFIPFFQHLERERENFRLELKKL